MKINAHGKAKPITTGEANDTCTVLKNYQKIEKLKN